MKVYYADGHLVMQFGLTMEQTMEKAKHKEEQEYWLSQIGTVSFYGSVRPGSVIMYKPSKRTDSIGSL